MELREVFEQQLEFHPIMTEKNIGMFNINYYNGEPIKIGDRVLSAFTDDGNNMIFLNETHFKYFIPDCDEPMAIPSIKLKKS